MGPITRTEPIGASADLPLPVTIRVRNAAPGRAMLHDPLSTRVLHLGMRQQDLEELYGASLRRLAGSKREKVLAVDRLPRAEGSERAARAHAPARKGERLVSGEGRSSSLRRVVGPPGESCGGRFLRALPEYRS
jgi:hypothetical protein